MTARLRTRADSSSWLRQEIDQGPVREAWRQALQWVGPPDGELATLHPQGARSMNPVELGEQLSERVGAPVQVRVSEWSTWDESRRRRRDGAIDDQTFQMLRGLEEHKYNPTQASA